MTVYQPILSKKNTLFILDILEKNKIDLLIEFGSGGSTIFFIEKIKNLDCKFVSVEISKYWFYKNIEIIKQHFGVKNGTLKKTYWNNRDYKNFITSGYKPYTPIIKGESRYPGWVRDIKYGPFARFHPSHSKRSSGKFEIFWTFIKPVFLFFNRLMRIFPRWKQENSTFQINISNLNFIYRLINPARKDQFGESPKRNLITTKAQL